VAAARLGPMTFRLTKHHGLGNDFLIHRTEMAVDRDGWPERARAWCDRRRGIGADGLIIGSPGTNGADLTMTLFNADGSRAEISGNGIRCLAQAEAHRLGVERVTLRIATDAGRRTCVVGPGADQAEAWVEVEMGAVRPGPAPDRPVTTVDAASVAEATGDLHALALDAAKERLLDIGNPHLVLLVEDPDRVDIAAAGALHEAAYDGGMNVHAVAPTPGQPGAVTVVHWERGVGVTQACGSGACAVAVAVHDWGLAGPEVLVHMPGGDATVRVEGAEVTLVAPANFVADIEVP